MHVLKKYLNKYTSLSNSDWDIIKQAFIRKEVKKNELILEEGKICRHFYFLEEGLLRFFYNDDGKDVVKTFTFPPYCFTSESSFLNQRPSIENIQAITNSIVWHISYEKYKELEKQAFWEVFTKHLLSEFDEYLKTMIIHLKNQSPRQRYFWLTENLPQSLLQCISQKDLASFLGITPQSLCRIKNNLHKVKS